MDAGKIYTTLTHSDFGDPECCGCLNGITEGKHARIECNECGTVLANVPAVHLGLPGVPLKAATLGQPTLRRFSPGSKMLTLGREMFQHSDKGRNLFVSSDAAELPLSDE
jgi:ribosomal protein S27E